MDAPNSVWGFRNGEILFDGKPFAVGPGIMMACMILWMESQAWKYENDVGNDVVNKSLDEVWHYFHGPLEPWLHIHDISWINLVMGNGDESDVNHERG
jgi:hypothetical protein